MSSEDPRLQPPLSPSIVGAQSTVGRSGTTTPNSEPPQEDSTLDQTSSLIKRAKVKSRTDLKAIDLPQAAGYEVKYCLGRGTFGTVWLGVDGTTGEEVAIKFFRHGTGRQWQLLQAEVKQLALLSGDPGIVHLKDVEAEANPPYYVMAYAPKGSLQNLIRQRQQLPLEEALAIFRRIAEALAYVHAKGIRHCDLKPSNILLDARDKPLIADFGQAHLSSDASQTLGTFFYMAPEQADEKRQIPDTRWDVYGLGALFYAMLTGHPPREQQDLRRQIESTRDLPSQLRIYREGVYSAPRPADHRKVRGMDRDLADLIDRCLEADPAKRLRDAGAVLNELERRERRKRRQPLLILGGILTIAVLVMTMIQAYSATEAAGRKSWSALREQIKDSHQAMAYLVKEVISDELLDRKMVLQDLANRDDFLQAFRHAIEEKETQELRSLVRKRYNKLKFYNFLVVDRAGDPLAYHSAFQADPLESGTRINFSFRDWFNGDGDKPANTPGQIAPHQKDFHVSQPYVGKFSKGKMLIALSVPIRLGQADAVPAGILMGAVEIKELHRWLPQAIDNEHTFVALVNRRGHCLKHAPEQAEQIEPRPDEHPTGYVDYADLFRRITEDLFEHADPVDGKVYLACFAAGQGEVPGALVLHAQSKAEEPVTNLKWQMHLNGIKSVAVFAFFLALLWGAVFWAFRREERLAHG